MRAFVSSLSLVLAVTSLSGCYSFDPSPMGRGYSSYNQLYKSAPGVDAKDVGYDFSAEANAAIQDKMRPAAIDLVSKLSNHLSFSTDKIYLVRSSNTVFHSTFSYLLQDELIKSGYHLSSRAEGAVPVEFVAKDLSREDVMSCDKAVEFIADNNVYLALAMDVVEGVPQKIIGGFYNVPMNGFVPVGKLKIDVTSALPCSI